MYLYEIVKNKIRNEILNGNLKRGDLLPSELELAEEFGVSRITIRRAIKELEAQGLLRVDHGVGTFVEGDSNMNIKILDISGFSEYESSESIHFRRKILSKEIIEDNNLDIIFEYDSPKQYIRLERIIYYKEKPRFKDISYFPLHLYEGIEDKIVEDVSTLELLRNDYNISFDNFIKNISVVFDKEISKELDLLPHDPLILVKKKIIDDDIGIIHYSTYYLIAKEVTLELNTLL